MTPLSPMPRSPEAELDAAAENLRGVLDQAIEHGMDKAALVVADRDCALARTLTDAYRRCLPQADFLQFDPEAPDEVLAAFERLRPGDLVVLIQSTSFRLHSFRIRMELFRRGLAVIEHPHLGRMPGIQASIYVDSLAYDRGYYRGVGSALKLRIDRARVAVVVSAGEQLVYPAGLEPAKLNVGDYTDLANTGGQFPIGEVFTESRDLEAVRGRVVISFFGDTDFRVNRPPRPITLIVEAGRVTDTIDATPAFEQVLAVIRAGEGEVWLRELGFGMNRAFTQERTVSDIGTFERMCGVHLSLGAKHASYNKANIRKKTARYHVDVFVLTESVLLDGEEVYRDGTWDVRAHGHGA